MKFSVRRFINKQCIALSFTISWSTGLSIEADIFFWRFDLVLWGF